MSSEAQRQDFTVAIIGSGITGVVLGLALAARSIPFTIYEQGASISTTGAGLSANPSGVAALRYASEDAYQAYKSVKSAHWPGKREDELYFVYTDGRTNLDVTCNGEFGAMHRVGFIKALASKLPDGCTRFQKRLRSITTASSGRSVMMFEDGSEVLADVVIGCDGVKSKVRPFVVGANHPSAQSGFSHIVCYRGMVPKQKADEIIGTELTSGAVVHIGPGTFSASYPIAHDLLSFTILKALPGPWPHLPSLTHATEKSSLLTSLETASASAQALASLLPEVVDTWAVFDTADNLLPTYSSGCVAVAGDAAHAATPNLAAGASQGYEDVAVLAALLMDIRDAHSSSEINGDREPKQDGLASIHRRIKIALSAFSHTRLERSHRVVVDSRHWGNRLLSIVPGEKTDIKDMEQDLNDAYEYIWTENIEEQIDKARQLVAKGL